jgi:copper chaperone CopZ
MKKEYNIYGMSCNHCVMSVEKQLLELNLNEFKVEIGSAEVEYDETKIEEKEIIKAIEEAGYKVIQ